MRGVSILISISLNLIAPVSSTSEAAGFLPSRSTANNNHQPLPFIRKNPDMHFAPYRSNRDDRNGGNDNRFGTLRFASKHQQDKEKSFQQRTVDTFSNTPDTTSRRELIHRIASGAAAALTSSWIGDGKSHNNAALAAVAHSPITSTPPLASSPSSPVNDPTVLSLKKGSRIVHIVGTAHISSSSADLAKRLVEYTRPDAVFVELDQMRISSAFEGGIPPPGIKIAVQDQHGKLWYGVTQESNLGQRILQKFINFTSKPTMYRQFEMAGFPVGEEFVNSVQAGLENESLIILGDRRMDITLEHISKALEKVDATKLQALDSKLTETMKSQMPIMEEWENRGPAIRPDEFSEFVETMKTRDTTKQLMDVVKKEVPELWRALIGERDTYMARGINALDSSKFHTVVAVMGLGHLDGVAKTLKGMRWSVIS